MSEKIAPIEQSLLTDRVYESLRQAILTGDLPPGERLVEAELAKTIGVSRAPIREAISRLESEGLVELRPRRGSYVSTLSKEDVWEIYTLRAALEGLAYRILGEHLRDEDVAELQSIVDEMKSCVKESDQAKLSSLDTAFHRKVVELAGHDRLLSAWMSIIGQIQLLSQQVTREYHDLSRVPQRHQVLLDVLRTGSEIERVTAIHEHIDSVAERMLSRLVEEP